MTIKQVLCSLLVTVGVACSPPPGKKVEKIPEADSVPKEYPVDFSDTVPSDLSELDSMVADSGDRPEVRYYTGQITALEQAIINAGLIEVQTVAPDIVCNLKYTTTDNFLGEDVYGEFERCYLQPDAAQGLATAQRVLSEKRPGYRLMIFDAVRPRQVQQKMWDLVDKPIAERTKYVSNPKNGSLHNFGAAVDLTIVDENGDTLNMGTAFDHFGELAYPRREQALFDANLLSKEVIDNRRLLREVMLKGGFTVLPTEWWHFNFCSRKEAYERYTIIE